VVKVNNQWRRHSVRQRLGASRARREAIGYQMFQRRGLATPTLLAWGEERVGPLWRRAVVLTERIDAPSLVEAFEQRPDLSLVETAIETLAQIHIAGLAHGDPNLNNFLMTEPQPTAIDLAACRRLTAQLRRTDLAKFLAWSMASLDLDDSIEALLRSYEQSAAWSAGKNREKIISQARARAASRRRRFRRHPVGAIKHGVS